MSDKAPDKQRVVLKGVRLSFPVLIEAQRATPTSEPKFGTNVIMDPNSESGKANIAACKEAISAAELEHFGKGGILKHIEDPKRIALLPGDKFKSAETFEVYEGYEGMVGLKARNPRRPALFDRHKRPVERPDIEDVFIGGQTVDVIVRFFCVSDKDKGGAGLFCSLQAVRAHQEGEKFGGGPDITGDEFDDLGDDGFGSTEQPSDDFGGHGLLD